jgi:hypothetical protein
MNNLPSVGVLRTGWGDFSFAGVQDGARHHRISEYTMLRQLAGYRFAA